MAITAEEMLVSAIPARAIDWFILYIREKYQAYTHLRVITGHLCGMVDCTQSIRTSGYAHCMAIRQTVS